jgi:hypothetical protein
LPAIWLQALEMDVILPAKVSREIGRHARRPATSPTLRRIQGRSGQCRKDSPCTAGDREIVHT